MSPLQPRSLLFAFITLWLQHCALSEVIFTADLSDLPNTGWNCTGTGTSSDAGTVTLSGGSYAIKTINITDYYNISIEYSLSKGYCRHTCLLQYRYNIHYPEWIVIGWVSAYTSVDIKPLVPIIPGSGVTTLSIKLYAPNSCNYRFIQLTGNKITNQTNIVPTVHPFCLATADPTTTLNPSTQPTTISPSY